jgi:hypothetical protein
MFSTPCAILFRFAHTTAHKVFESSPKTKWHQRDLAPFHFVGVRGLEPPCLAAYGPEPYVSAISPHAQANILHIFTKKHKQWRYAMIAAQARVV